jgi:hypothetical protein
VNCLQNAGASTSHNPMGLHGLLQGHLYIFVMSDTYLEQEALNILLILETRDTGNMMLPHLSYFYLFLWFHYISLDHIMCGSQIYLLRISVL